MKNKSLLLETPRGQYLHHICLKWISYLARKRVETLNSDDAPIYKEALANQLLDQMVVLQGILFLELSIDKSLTELAEDYEKIQYKPLAAVDKP